MKLHTSRWANRGLSRLPVVPVGISRGTPRFPVPYRYRMARLRAPSRATFALRGDADFERAYLAELEEAGVDRIADLLRKISDEEDGADLALLCYEDVHAGQVCHRRMFAQWWEGKTGQRVEELGNVPRGTFQSPPTQPQLFTEGEEKV